MSSSSPHINRLISVTAGTLLAASAAFGALATLCYRDDTPLIGGVIPEFSVSDSYEFPTSPYTISYNENAGPVYHDIVIDELDERQISYARYGYSIMTEQDNTFILPKTDFPSADSVSHFFRSLLVDCGGDMLRTVRDDAGEEYWSVRLNDAAAGEYRARTEDTRKALAKACVYDGMNEADAVSNMIEYIVDACEYDMTLARNTAADAYEGSAVCAGYAKALHDMCSMAGVRCRYVVGYLGETCHAWNEVLIGDRWYAVDVTTYDGTRNAQYKCSPVLWEGYTSKHELKVVATEH